MDENKRRQILEQGKPSPSDKIWWGEANLGGWYTEAEIDAVVEAIRESMDWHLGFDPKSFATVKKFEKAFAAYCGASHAIATNSCGTGIDMVMRALDLKPGDEVICPAVNYKAAHLAILDRGARVVFCDIDASTLNLDLKDTEARITERTRAIFPVSMNGLPAPIDELISIAERHQHPNYGPPKIINDAARACGASSRGKKIGSNGWASIFSFQSMKHMTTLGEGGMITTNDRDLASRLRDIRGFGGENGWGSNYKMNKIQAAVGLVQLSRLDEMNERRRSAATRRTKILQSCPDLQLPHEPDGYKHIYYVYSILVRPDWAGDKRDQLMQILEDKYGICCSITNPPVYERWPYIGRKCGVPDLPNSQDVGRRMFCPPLHPLLSEEQELYICASIIEAVETVRDAG